MNTVTRNSNTKFIIGGLVVALLLVLTFAFLNAPDRRTPTEKLGDAVSQLGNGVDDAARELEDRTPAERINDGVRDATDGSPQ